MKKILFMVLFLPFISNASQAKQSEKIVNEEIIQLKKQVAELDKKIDQLHEKKLSIEPIIVVEAKQPLELIDTTEEQPVKKPKISWGKRSYPKDKVVEKKEANKKDDKEEESIVDADDDQGGD